MVLIWLAVWLIVGIVNLIFNGGFDLPHIGFNNPDGWSVTLAISAYLSLFQRPFTNA